MIGLLLLLLAQDVPASAQDAVEGEDIVVRATFGRTTMLFDKGADGKLRNCRIMVSSGSQKRDTDACQATPVCYAKTADEVTDCIDLIAVAPVSAAPVAAAGTKQVFELPQMVRPKQPMSPNQIGPNADAEESRETERQRVKPLPPPPSAPKSEPVVRVTTGSANAQDQ